MGLLRSCFARTQTWLQSGKYVSALASDLTSRNGWSVAEHAGDRTPDRSQRLLSWAACSIEDYVGALIDQRLSSETLLLPRTAEALRRGTVTLSDDCTAEFAEFGVSVPK